MAILYQTQRNNIRKGKLPMTHNDVSGVYISDNSEKIKSKIWLRALSLHKELGFSIAPVNPTDKHPWIEWKKYQTEKASEEQISRWATEKTDKTHPTDNYCIITGKISGIIVIECDDQEAKDYVREHCPLTKMVQASASNKRSHHYVYKYKLPEGWDRVPGTQKHTINGKKYNMDIRADGGLIVGPCSFRPDTNKTYDEVYPWTKELFDSIPEFDPTWIDYKHKNEKPKDVTPSNTTLTLTEQQESAKEWMQFQKGSIWGFGKGADNYAISLAIQLLWDFDLTPEDALPIMLQWGTQESNVDEYGHYEPWTYSQISHKLYDAEGKEPEKDGVPIGKPRGWRLEQHELPKLMQKIKERFENKPKIIPTIQELPIEEIIVHVKDVFEEPTQEQPKNKNYWSSEELDGREDPTFIVDDHLLEEKMAVVCAPQAYLKSFWSLDMMLSISTGKPFLDKWETRQGGTLYLAGEGGGGYKRRVKAWRMAKNNAKHIPKEDFMLREGRINLCNPIETMKLIKEIAEMNINNLTAIVVDTKARFYVGKENDGDTTNLFVESIDMIIKHLHVTVLIVDHTPISNDRRIRGHTGLAGAADTIFNIWKQNKDSDILTVYNDKQKDIEELNSYNITAKKIHVFPENPKPKLQYSLVINHTDEQARSDEQINDLRSVYHAFNSNDEKSITDAYDSWKCDTTLPGKKKSKDTFRDLVTILCKEDRLKLVQEGSGAKPSTYVKL